MRQTYVEQIVEAWEDSYKKGLLTFWVLLSLHNGPKHMRQIKQYIEQDVPTNIVVDEKSLYRSITRFKKLELISSSNRTSNGGPDFKVYSLTNTGLEALCLFYTRNVARIFLTPLFTQQTKGLSNE